MLENKSKTTATGSVLFSYLTCLHSTTSSVLSLLSLVETISLKTWERPMTWRAKCSLQVAVRGMLEIPLFFEVDVAEYPWFSLTR